MRPHPALQLATAFALALVELVAPPAHAHGERNANVRAVLDPLPPELAGMRFEVHRTIAPQLVVANPTPRVLEVLDDDGIAFARIGPDGVDGNVARAAWFQTYGPGAPVPASARDPGASPRWLRARRETSYGWFDPRVDASAVEVPHDVLDAQRPADVGRWQIALRVDGTPATLTGRFRFAPPANDGRSVRLTSPARLAPGVVVRVLPGTTPGVFVKNTSRRLLTVLDETGTPFLRIGPNGVEANVRSVGWHRSGRGVDARPHDGPADLGLPHWRRVARGTSYSWLEPRLTDAFGLAGAVPGSDAARRAWALPVRLGSEELLVTGESTWRAQRPSDAALASAR